MDDLGSRRDDLQRAVEKTVDAVRAECGVPGACVTLYIDGERCFHGASGSADAHRQEPLSADALFPSYSITKTMTAIGALRMAEKGLLSLETSLDAWLPELAWSRDVSLRQLLGHTAGVPNYSGVRSQIEALHRSPERAWSFDEFVRFL